MLQDNEFLCEGKLIKCIDPNLAAYSISNWKPKLVDRMKSLLSQKQDLDYARACLNQMLFEVSTSLIDRSLINSAIQLLCKCFSNSKGSRPMLNPEKVFRIYAESIGEADYTNQYRQFQSARNTIIIHDQDEYLNAGCGVVVDRLTGMAVNMIEYSIKTSHLYKENKRILLKLVDIATKFVAQQLEEIEKTIIDDYNSEKPKLPELESAYENMEFDHAW